MLNSPSIARADASLTLESGLGGAVKALKKWTPAELHAMRTLSVHEKDPRSGKSSQFQGVALSDLVDRALAGEPPEQKAQIDLIVVHAADGHGGRSSTAIPRSFLTKYPVLLALKKDGHALADPECVPPWTSHPRSQSEGLPVASYFVEGVTSIELANYGERFGSFFLKRRMDPGSVRGEKIFVQNCMACHDRASAPALGEGSHPEVPGYQKLSDRDRRALTSYRDAFRAQTVQAAAPAASAGAATKAQP